MREITVVSLDPIIVGDWVFKVSANVNENGVLVFASNNVLCYYRCRYFQNHFEARRWINSLGFINEETLGLIPD